MMTRRIFMKNGSLALVSLGFTPVFIARSAEAAQTRKKILVAIFQRGAVDGLNMIVPFGDKNYYAVRFRGFNKIELVKIKAGEAVKLVDFVTLTNLDQSRLWRLLLEMRGEQVTGRVVDDQGLRILSDTDAPELINTMDAAALDAVFEFCKSHVNLEGDPEKNCEGSPATSGEGSPSS